MLRLTIFKLDKCLMGVAHMVNSWAVKRQMRRGFPSNFGTLVALDGFVWQLKSQQQNH
jgi:hypothetical protein